MSKHTPFYDIHRKLGAKLIDFGGFEMPVQYESIKKEHNAVRNAVGLFDVSHMGEFYIHGPEALDLIQHVTINDASKLEPGKAQYSAMCYEDGGIVDDLVVYMTDENRYIVVVNASNIQKDLKWIRDNNSFEAELEDLSEDVCLLAVQGPKSIETFQKLTDINLSEIGFYRFKMATVAGFDYVTISATGYTGERGLEVYFNTDYADPEGMWNAIMEAGEEFGIEPCGLGARDTLRLEMGFALYGNDITKDTNPLEARLGWLTKLDKGSFIGREVLKRVKKEGINRKLVGFTIQDKRAIPRPGYKIYDENESEIGFVTSGSQSITLGKGIGMGYIHKDFTEEGTKIYIKIRNNRASAAVTYPPFIKTK